MVNKLFFFVPPAHNGDDNKIGKIFVLLAHNGSSNGIIQMYDNFSIYANVSKLLNEDICKNVSINTKIRA